MTSILFSQLRGQKKAKRLLAKALSSQRIPHAFLFRGIDGVGKARAALALAARINCRGKKNVLDLDACGECSSCNKYKKKIHPDFQHILPDKGAIKIKQIRQMIRAMEYPPYEARVRVTLLEDIHTMRQEAANALLKTLEEPHAGNILIATAAESKSILTTVASRCQQIAFTSLSQDDTVELLAAKDIPQQETSLLALLSGGSPGAALLLQKYQMLSLWQETIIFLMNPYNYEVNRENKKEIRKTATNAINENSLIELLELAAKMAELKTELPLFFSLLQRWLRDLLLQDRKALELYCPEYSTLWESWSPSIIFPRQEALDTAEKQILQNCNALLVCETLLFTLQR